MHHILKYAASSFDDWALDPIPISSEKFLAMNVRIRNKYTVNFIDSLQFLGASLSKLTKNMLTLPLSETVFGNSMVKSKGIFPYDMAISVEALESIVELPPNWDSEHISTEDYTHAQSVWREYNCQNLRDYMMVYLRLDVYLLADIFEAFRKKSMADDDLEPLCFYGIPGKYIINKQ